MHGDTFRVALGQVVLSVLGFGSFVFFAVSGKSTEGHLDRCAPDCVEADVHRMRTQYLLADIADTLILYCS